MHVLRPNKFCLPETIWYTNISISCVYNPHVTQWIFSRNPWLHVFLERHPKESHYGMLLGTIDVSDDKMENYLQEGLILIESKIFYLAL